MSNNAGSIPKTERIISVVCSSDNLYVILNSVIEQINKRVKKQNKKLRRELNAHVPSLRFVHKGLDAFLAESSERYRIIVIDSDDDVRDILPDVLSLKDHQSHIIIAVYSKNKSGDNCIWQHSDYADAKVVFSSGEDLLRIVLEISADIQLSHYYGVASEDISKCKELSEQKVKYVTHNKIYDWGKNPPNYVSLASFFRKEDCHDFNSGPYLKNWSSFIKGAYGTTRNNDIENLTNRILESRRDGNQISRKKLKHKLSGLSSGKYILVRLAKRPHNKRIKRTLLKLFGINKIRVGKIAVEPYIKYYSFEKYSRYLDISIFEV